MTYCITIISTSLIAEHDAVSVTEIVTADFPYCTH